LRSRLQFIWVSDEGIRVAAAGSFSNHFHRSDSSGHPAPQLFGDPTVCLTCTFDPPHSVLLPHGPPLNGILFVRGVHSAGWLTHCIFLTQRRPTPNRPPTVRQVRQCNRKLVAATSESAPSRIHHDGRLALHSEVCQRCSRVCRIHLRVACLRALFEVKCVGQYLGQFPPFHCYSILRLNGR
jgi:hypothetical protein